MLNVKPSNLMLFFKTYNNYEVVIKFADQFGRPLEIEEKVYLTLLINK